MGLRAPKAGHGDAVLVFLRLAEALDRVAEALDQGDTRRAGELLRELSVGFETLAEVIEETRSSGVLPASPELTRVGAPRSGSRG